MIYEPDLFATEPPPHARHDGKYEKQIRQPTNEDKFWAFHWANPHVYRWLESHTIELFASGRTSYGIAMLTEDFRTNVSAKTSDPDFKINNNHKAYFARLLMARNPQIGEFFRIRVQKATQKRSNNVRAADLPPIWRDTFIDRGDK